MKELTFGYSDSPDFAEYNEKMKRLQLNGKEFFTLDEFLYSDCALHMKLRNEPTVSSLENLCTLVRRVLWPARLVMGSPIYITSGYRSAAVNNAVGGAVNSFHRLGRAADVSAANLEKLFKVLELLPHTELIRYKNFIHVAL